VGFVLVAPPSVAQSVHSRRAPEGVCLRPGGATSELVPSLPFHPASTVCSALSLAGLLHPATDHGVRQVSNSLPSYPKVGRCEPSSLAPTLRSFSLPGSLPASPRSVPSRRWTSKRLPTVSPRLGIATSPSTSGPCSTKESVAGETALPLPVARCSLGLRTPTGVCDVSDEPTQAPRTGRPIEAETSVGRDEECLASQGVIDPLRACAPEGTPCRPGRTARLTTAGRVPPPPEGDAPGTRRCRAGTSRGSSADSARCAATRTAPRLIVAVGSGRSLLRRADLGPTRGRRQRPSEEGRTSRCEPEPD